MAIPRSDDAPKYRWIVSGRRIDSGAHVRHTVLSRSEARARSLVADTGVIVDSAVRADEADAAHASTDSADETAENMALVTEVGTLAVAAPTACDEGAASRPEAICPVCDSQHLRLVRVPRLGVFVQSFGQVTAGVGVLGLLLACFALAYLFLRDPRLAAESTAASDQIVVMSALSLMGSSWLLFGAGLALATQRRILRCEFCSASVSAD